MRASVLLSAPAFAIAALAQSSSGDNFPQTSYLTQTNSLGVVTGMPAPANSIPGQPNAASSQPPLNTDIPPVQTIPAVSPGVQTILIPGPSTNVNATRTVVVSANNSTTVVLGEPATSGAGASGSGSVSAGTVTGTASNGASGSGASGASKTGSATASSHSGAAATMGALAGSLVGAGALVAAFL